MNENGKVIDLQEMEAREKIIQAAQALLQEGVPPDDITVRQIAARAGVGIGTLSYHFHSKEKLLFDAVGGLMSALAGGADPRAAAMGEGTALERLKRFLSATGDIALQYRSICSVQLSYELTRGDMGICYYITPLLKEHFAGRKSDLEIKLIALELITTLQAVFLKQEAFHKYTGMDIQNPSQRQETLELLLNSVINQ